MVQPLAKHVPALAIQVSCLTRRSRKIVPTYQNTQACSEIGLCVLLTAPTGQPAHAPLLLCDAAGRTVMDLLAPGEPFAVAINTTHIYVADKVGNLTMNPCI